MPIINTLREKMGRLVVVVVGLSIMAFVLTDLLGPQSSILGQNKREVGEIAGETIPLEDYSALVEQLRVNYTSRGINVNEFMMNSLREQAWNQLIQEVAFQKEYANLGIAVTSDERVDMVQGNNPHPFVQQNFTNPQTGLFDRETLINYLASVDLNPQARFEWQIFENNLVAARMQDKYNNLMAKTSYVPLALAQQEYEIQVGEIDVDYAYFPFFSIPDSTVTITDSDLRSYLREHSEEYQVSENRSMEYVSFPIIPSVEDSAYYRDELARLRTQLVASEDDSTYAIVNTETGGGFNTVGPPALPADLINNYRTLQTGDVIGPKLTNGVYTLFKVSDIVESDEEYVRASHILIKTDGMTDVQKRAARTKANGLLRRARNGENFEQLARENSEDGSASQGGDLNWYQKGTGWDTDFEAATFSRRSPGLINRVVESQFGYHIIKVVDAPTKNQYKVATILITMTPSDATRNDVYQQAGLFATDASGYNEFNQLASNNGYAIFSADNILASSQNAGRLANAREIVRWLYNDASIGEVKEFELDGEYIVAVYTKAVEEGTADLENVRNEIRLKVMNEKKAALVRSRAEALSGTLAEIASAYGTEAQVYNAAQLRLNTNSLPNVGTAPEAVGAAFALVNVGDRTSLIETDNGMVIVELKAKTAAPEIADYTTYETQLFQRQSARANFALQQSVREKADIKDERYKHY